MGGLIALIQNVGGTTVLVGAEAEAQAVFGNFSADAGLSLEKSKLGSVTVLDPNTGDPVSLGGRALPLAPPWTANVGAQYAFPLPNSATLTPRIDVSNTGGQWATPFQRFGEYLPERTLVNAQVAYVWQKWKATIYATNAFNQHYIIAVNVGVPDSLRYAGAPQQFGIRVERSF